MARLVKHADDEAVCCRGGENAQAPLFDGLGRPSGTMFAAAKSERGNEIVDSRYRRGELVVEVGVKLIIGITGTALVFWLVEGNFWLKFFLSSAMAVGVNLSIETTALRREVQGLREMFAISDRQVIHLSQHVERFSEKESDWDEVGELRSRIEDLEGA